MLKTVKKLSDNPWIIGIFTPIIATAISTTWISLTKKINLKDSIAIVFNFIGKILNYKIALWIIVILMIFLILVNLIIRSIKSDSNKPPKWCYTFKTMEYKQWIFTWNYEEYYDKYKIKDIRPICNCGCELIDLSGIPYSHYAGSILKCPNCEKTCASPPMDVIGSVDQLIRYKIKTNNYPK